MYIGTMNRSKNEWMIIFQLTILYHAKKINIESSHCNLFAYEIICINF